MPTSALALFFILRVSLVSNFKLNTPQIYTAERIFTGENWLKQHAVIVDQEKITDVVPVSGLSSSQRAEQFDNCIIVPAFIDLQIYGANGKLLAVHPGKEALHDLVSYCQKGGAACCLPAVATNTPEVFYQCIDAVRAYWSENGTGVLGLHLEGPWISVLKRGAHVESLIHSPSLNEVKELLDYGKGVIKMITLAPEVCEKEIIELIVSQGIIVSAGHSNATYMEAKQQFANGITAATHLFNAMSSLNHREPGLVGAIMDDKKIMASIIPDGHHVDYAAIRIAKEVMKGRLFAITDAVTLTDNGYYHHQPAGDKYEAAGILSGSSLTMTRALKNLVECAGISLEESLRMCSLYPAQLMKIDTEWGRIGTGYISRMLVLNDALEPVEML